MKLIIYILLLFNPIISFGQITFFNSYGGAGNDYGKSIITTIDTAYVIIGATESFGNGNTDMYLFKIDSLGNLLWSKTFGGTNVDWGTDLKQTIDTGYIICGYSNSYSWDYDIFLVKTDQNGDSIWTNTYGGTDWEFAYSIATTADTGYIIAGETYSYGSGLSDGYAVKLDSMGDTLWTKTFGGIGKDVFNDVIETKSGDLLFVGSTTTVDGDTDYWLVKTDNLGNEIWQYTAGDSLDEVVNSVVDLIDSNYYFIGTKESIVGTALVMDFQKINKNGFYSSGNYYDQPLDETGNFILQYANQTDIILGGRSTSVGNGGYDVLNLKISQGGFGTLFSNDGTSSDENTEEADTTADNGIVIVGTTGGTANGITSVFVMKTDASLNSSATISEVFDITSVNPLYTENTLYIYPNPTSNNITFSSQSNILNHPYKIFNLLGEVVRNGILKSEQIDISDLINGVYFINIPSISNKSYPFTKI
jgi:hypothetical protein